MELSYDQQETLESRARARRAARSVERVRIVLLAGAGLQDQQIAAKLKITPAKAARWRNRFLDSGFAALDKDAPRPGRTPTITPAKVQEVIRKTTQGRQCLTKAHPFWSSHLEATPKEPISNEAT
jgi:transposase